MAHDTYLSTIPRVSCGCGETVTNDDDLRGRPASKPIIKDGRLKDRTFTTSLTERLELGMELMSGDIQGAASP
ncbi:MAG TPA: hypothetical protein DET40_04645 [Lentisphaeria bacterium]|nr:MAG: hypothetical protein A2X45_21475 [Lentisphaerae bacterium GWF2_50_93]HCE42813.1 hypothetical protein [Lentisphaeria bacterium]